MNRKATIVFSSAAAVTASIILAVPGRTQVGIDFGSGSSLGVSGIPGVDSSPWPSQSLLPSTVGGGNASSLSSDMLNGQSQSFNTSVSNSADATTQNAPGMPTSQQAYAIPMSRSTGNLPQTGMNLMATQSVDTTAIPSAQWKYGFQNQSAGLYRGVTGGNIGGFLGPTSTASVDLNTYDGPSRLPLSYGQMDGTDNINFATTIGGVRVGGTVNTGNALGAVQDFFNQP